MSTKFIDQALLEIYSISVTSLIGVINNGNQQDTFLVILSNSSYRIYSSTLLRVSGYVAQQKLQELALSLSLQCLSFDFMETSDNGSSDDVSAIQVLLNHGK